MNKTALTKQELQSILKGLDVVSGSLTVDNIPFFKNPVPFSFVQTNKTFFLFLFEPHNEKSLTNAIEPSLSLLLKTLHSQNFLTLNNIQESDIPEIDKSLRVFQEDSEGRIDEIIFNLGVSGGQPVKTQEKGNRKTLKVNKQKNQEIGSVSVSNLRWRPLTAELLKIMRIFDLKN